MRSAMNKEETLYTRTEMLLGEDAVEKLKAAKVEELIRSLIASGLLERVERGGYPCIRLSASGKAKLYEG